MVYAPAASVPAPLRYANCVAQLSPGLDAQRPPPGYAHRIPTAERNGRHQSAEARGRNNPCSPPTCSWLNNRPGDLGSTTCPTYSLPLPAEAESLRDPHQPHAAGILSVQSDKGVAGEAIRSEGAIELSERL
jgi:hypothetical protein